MMLIARSLCGCLSSVGVLIGLLATPTIQAPLRRQAVTVPGTSITLEKGWRLLWTADDACAYTVPATWAPAPNHAWVVNPDGRITVTVADTPSAGWPQQKTRLKDSVHPTSVLDDSDRRLWIERADPQRILHYLAISDGHTVCTAELQVQRSADPTSEIVNKILSGVRVSNGADLEWMKR
jgi:hypothetical protein